MKQNWQEDYQNVLAQFAQEHRHRKLPVTDNSLINLSTNDYMGLGEDYERQKAFLLKCRHTPFTSSASRLLASCQENYIALEQKLQSLYGRPCLLFNSGYHANVGAIQAIAIKDTVVVSDKLVHASIIDGIRLSKAENKRFPHNDMKHLCRILDEVTSRHDYKRALIVTESIFSMDGDMAPLRELTEIKRRYPNVMLYVDEAHAFGVRGREGLGLAQEHGLMDDIDFLVATFGKAAASQGAFVCSSALMKDYLLNTARSFIFSTSLPPLNIAWTLENISTLEHMQEQRLRLNDISALFRNELSAILENRGLHNAAVAVRKSSHIVPLIVGDSLRTILLSEKLREYGFIGLPIRRPTVAEGAERIRFSLNANITENQIRDLLLAITELL